jgi:hypothetical protein
MTTETKRCSKCGLEKPLEEFHASGRSRRRPDCKDCRRAYRAAYNAAHRERIRAQWSAYYEANKLKEKERKAAWYLQNRERVLERQRAYRQGRKAREAAGS